MNRGISGQGRVALKALGCRRRIYWKDEVNRDWSKYVFSFSFSPSLFLVTVPRMFALLLGQENSVISHRLSFLFSSESQNETFLATFLHGHLFPSNEINQKITSFRTAAGIVIHNVTLGNRGNYSVVVNMNVHGTIQMYSQAVHLNVGGRILFYFVLLVCFGGRTKAVRHLIFKPRA